ncbi:CoA transferase [Phenylobacterium sp.]|uniref:CaiB/BaiF CoA transferase family protein n=1 Tax=Phenylobacterium sp. TaxID=1871053 RepID=UPI0025E2F466|nr:CoA transferase [Phenylobacterium sp.]
MGPLEGLKVIDLARFVAGPYCAMILADMGAEVIKVESGGGDSLRLYPPDLGGTSLNFHVMNRGKKGLSLDLRKPEGQAILKALVAEADVLVENFVPGTMEKMGCGWDELRAINPRLIMSRISGFGQDGPYAARPCFDSAAQAMSGLMDLTGPADGPPVLMGVFVCDHVAGLYSTIGVLAALQARERTGQGQMVDISLLESGASLLMTAIPNQILNGVTMGRNGARGRTVAPSNAFQAGDGRWVLILCGGDDMFARFLKAIDRLELLEDPRFASNAARVANLAATEAIVADWCARHDSAEIEAAMGRAGVPSAKIASVAEMVDNPQLRHRGFIVEIPQGGGVSLPMQGPVTRLSETPVTPRGPTPRAGEHTEAVLESWLGYDPGRIAELRRDGVV